VPARLKPMPRSTVESSLVCSKISLDRGAEPVLREISFSIGPGARLGVVGPNGVGKSTLLKVIAGLETPDSGKVLLTPPGAACVYVEQEREPRQGETVRAAVLRRSGIEAADRELEEAAAELGSGKPGAEERYSAAVDRVAATGADRDAVISAVLTEAGLEELSQRETSVLSGGESAKVVLVALRISPADILLLDEPTNDLDFSGLEDLEEIVVSRRQPTIVVSHDRAFLERTVTEVLELDEHDHTGQLFDGGWAAYEEERATARRHAEEAYEVYESRKRGLEHRARREREWATTGVRKEVRSPKDNDKAQRDFRINKTEKLAARARRTDREAERLEVVEKPWEGWQLRFTIGEAHRAGDVVARLEEAVVDQGDFRLGPIDFELSWADRLAIVGRNGAGKSTLVAALLGRVDLSRGRRHLGPGVVVGELGQERQALSGAKTLLEAVCSRCDLKITEARNLLAKFGLGADEVTRPGRSLSPGERTRAELATFQARGVNLLVLDEPTNHLDLPAIEQLEQALDSFGGTLVLVSHDRRLLEQVRLTRRIELDHGSITSDDIGA
jgi:ATPase subunit of ABC transporter with duplicated ATPase domains